MPLQKAFWSLKAYRGFDLRTGTCNSATGNLTMAKPEETLEELLDIVSCAREELVAVERRLERLKDDIAKAQKQNSGSRKTR